MKKSKQMKIILKAYYKLIKDDDSVKAHWLYSGDFDFSIEDYIKLEAKQLIIFRTYVFQEDFYFRPSPLGITYLEDRTDKLVRFLIPTIMSFISTITAVIALILQL